MYTKHQNLKKLLKKKLFYIQSAFFFAIIWSEQNKIDKVFLVKQQTYLLKPGK